MINKGTAVLAASTQSSDNSPVFWSIPASSTPARCKTAPLVYKLNLLCPSATGLIDLAPTERAELDGDDLRRDPLAVRKATLASLLARAAPGLRFNEHLDEADGPLVFAHACKLGLEGIVSKRRDSSYSSGRSRHWIKSKNPQAPAVKREAEKEWGR